MLELWLVNIYQSSHWTWAVSCPIFIPLFYISIRWKLKMLKNPSTVDVFLWFSLLLVIFLLILFLPVILSPIVFHSSSSIIRIFPLLQNARPLSLLIVFLITSNSIELVLSLHVSIVVMLSPALLVFVLHYLPLQNVT